MITMTVTDTLGRPLRDLRISVTDRCNFRCVYCMPREVFGRDYQFLERAELLTFEELERLARIFVGEHGVTKIRLTGGEPLVRREVERLVEMLARIPGLGDLAMTTNGSALARKAQALRDAGLRRITVSLDSLDDGVFAAINDAGFPVDRVLAGSRPPPRRGSPRSRSTRLSSAASTRTAFCRWPATSAAVAISCASSSSWTSATPTAGGWTTSYRRRRSSR
jgi:GTP 3',8-cyclase